MKQNRIIPLIVLFSFLFDTGCSLVPQRDYSQPSKSTPAQNQTNASEPAAAPASTSVYNNADNEQFDNQYAFPTNLDVSDYSHFDADTLRKLLWLRDQQLNLYSRTIDSLFFQVDSLNASLDDAYARADVNPDFVIPDTIRFAGRVFDLRNERYRDKFAETFKQELRLASVWIPRSGKYFALFDSIFAQTRVPKDVKYLAVAESSLNSMANSWAGAGGIWQFMPSTGRLYHLDIDSFIDERRNIFLATAAAGKYLEDAYDLLATKGANDWLLAFCSYNAGAGRILEVIKDQGGKDFFNLIMRVDETNQYVWRAVAIKVIFQYEEQIFGRRLDREQPIMKQCRLAKLDLRGTNDLNDWAKAQGTTISKVWELNPWIKMHKTNRGRRLTPLNSIVLGPGSYQILVPRDSQPDTTRLAAIERGFLERRNNVSVSSGSNATGGYEYYVVRKGDSIGKIAQRYGLTVTALKNMNGLKTNRVTRGQRLKVREIPIETSSDSTLVKTARPDSVKKAQPDSLKSTAKPDTLKNKKPAETKQPTKPEKPAVTKEQKKDNAAKTYVVKRGDTLYGIARKLNVTVDYLAKQNNLTKQSKLQVGQKIKY